ncbi:MAG: TonB-dependent receptor [Hydrogenophilaceae bacterium]|nr:TonB-dependent receptor [Hydrogenophilaceae bacterium]
MRSIWRKTLLAGVSGFTILSGAVLGGLALSAPAAAQDVASASEDEEAIVVTARRREESLQDVPLSISVLSGETLDQRGAENITILQETTPNATIQVARGSNSTLIGFIRGVGQQDPLWGFEPGVGLYVDDVYIARPQGAVLDIFDVERIEVLRGPQGTLYGRNTIGGAMKYVTRRLDPADPHLTARFNLGSYNQTDVILTGSLPVSETLVVGAAMGLYARDGYGENLFTGAEHYDKDVQAYRVSVEWTPSSDFFFRLSADRVTDDSNPKHGHREQPNGADPVYAPPESVYDTNAGSGDFNRVTTEGYSLLGQWNATDVVTFKSITAYREGATDGTIDFDNTPNPTLDIPAFYRDDQFSQEFQLLFDGDRVQGVAGFFYLDAHAEGAFDTVLGLANLSIFTSGAVDTESYAVFGDVSFDLTETLALSLGARWTRDERTGTVFRQNFTGIRTPFFGNAAAIPGLLRSDYTNSATFEEVTPRVSLTWEPSDEWTFYASYGRGYKSGGFDMRGDVVLTPNTVNGYQPEFVDAYEIGFHSNLFNGRANISGDIFYSEYQDVQITRQEPTVAGSVASFVDNAAAATIQGAELEGTVYFTDNFNSVFTIGYVDAAFDEYLSNTVVVNPAPPPATIVVPIDLSDVADIQNTPEWTWSLAFNYSIDLGPNGQIMITPSASYRGDSQMFELAAPLIDQEAFTLYNASITWTSDDDRFRIGLHGRNLGDEEYRVGGYNFPGALFGNSIIGFYGPPRTVTGSVEVRF